MKSFFNGISFYFWTFFNAVYLLYIIIISTSFPSINWNKFMFQFLIHRVGYVPFTDFNVFNFSTIFTNEKSHSLHFHFNGKRLHFFYIFNTHLYCGFLPIKFEFPLHCILKQKTTHSFENCSFSIFPSRSEIFHINFR